MITKALTLKLPVVNAQWINDILLNDKIGLQDFKHKKYQQFDLNNPYLLDYNMVSHIMGMLISFYILTNCALIFYVVLLNNS